jgi:branched-subunit amino acid transport protein AzlD
MAHWTGGKPTCRELGASDVVLVVFAAFLIPFYELIRAGNYWGRVNDWLDNPNYVEIAEIIQSGGFLGEKHHFWGLPLVIAGAQVAFGISGFAALIAISIACSVAASFLMYRLYGAVATVAFLILCPEWVRLSVMGGSEPLFLCLLLASWLAFRSDRVLMAVLLASFATMVRPVGFIALCAFAFTLILRRHWRELAMSICIGVGIGLAYLACLQVATGNAFINFKLYSASAWPSGNPFSLPFVQLAKNFFDIVLHRRWTGWLQSLFSILLLSFGAFALSKQMRTIPQRYPAEFTFAIAYLGFLACYNFGGVAVFLPRFAIPVLPFLLFTAHNWLPNNRFLVWPMAVLSALIASSALVGFKAVFGFSLHG